MSFGRARRRPLVGVLFAAAVSDCRGPFLALLTRKDFALAAVRGNPGNTNVLLCSYRSVVREERHHGDLRSFDAAILK